MFERPVVVVQDKMRIMLILALLGLCLLVLVFFQLLTGCTYQSTTFKELYCQPRTFSSWERVSIPKIEFDMGVVNPFEYKGETLELATISSIFIEVIGTQPSFVWLKAGAYVDYGNNIVFRTVYQTTMPDYFNTTRMPSWGPIVDRLTSNVPITSIYGWKSDSTMTVVYADGALKKYQYFNELDTYIQSVYGVNINKVALSTTFTCTSCFASESFKFSDFWKLLVGVGSLIGVCMMLIGKFLIDAVDYRQIQKPDDEVIPLSSIDSV
ncbi:MAG: hypothetical protein J3R72DRAFT_527242 [Linnemannia gamsii]|nr:MAG: hypothetical protein J3R72DRAFT_527242 [Linnemannia gamsii]